MRLIPDTNVIVSETIGGSYPFFIVDLVFADPNLELCFSSELFAEYVDVLNREKFAKFPDFLLKSTHIIERHPYVWFSVHT